MEARQAGWEERLQAAAQALGIDLLRLPERKSAPEKVRLATALKLTTSVSNGWLTQRLGMGQPGSVTQYARRFRLKGHAGKPDFKAALARLAKTAAP